MIRISVESLKPGMIIGRAIFDESKNVLLNKDVALTTEYIEKLKSRSIGIVYIQDGNTDDIFPDEIISEAVRSSAVHNMKKVFNSIKKIKKEIILKSKKEIIKYISSGKYHDYLKDNFEYDEITKDAKYILSDIITSPTVMMGMNSLKTYDDYIYQHAIDVTVSSLMIGRKIGLPEKKLKILGIGCMLMDIGNIFIPDKFVNKPGKLTKEEFNLVKEHTFLGYELLKDIWEFRYISFNEIGVIAPHVALQHHEKQDGSGYPRGISGDNSLKITKEPNTIHLYACIAAVADVFDALSSDKPNRKAYPPEKVIGLMSKLGGTHFNKEVLRVFLSITPVYPKGSTISVVWGKYKNHIGVVEAVNPQNLSKPIIRLIMNAYRKPITPITVNVLEERKMRIESVLL